MSDYDKLIKECRWEIGIFERPSAENSKKLIQAVNELQEENAKLAVFQCQSGYAAEGGVMGCQEIDKLRKELANAKALQSHSNHIIALKARISVLEAKLSGKNYEQD